MRKRRRERTAEHEERRSEQVAERAEAAREHTKAYVTEEHANSTHYCEV